MELHRWGACPVDRRKRQGEDTGGRGPQGAGRTRGPPRPAGTIQIGEHQRKAPPCSLKKTEAEGGNHAIHTVRDPRVHQRSHQRGLVIPAEIWQVLSLFSEDA